MVLPIIGVSQTATIKSAVNGSNEFCFDWLKQAYKKDNNLVFSPQSVSIAMAMAYDGSKWRTKSEIAKVMHFNRKISTNQQAWAEYINFFDQIKTPLFHMSNAALVQKNYNFLDSYINGVKNYKAMMKDADFTEASKCEIARENLNRWVERETEYKIKSLIHKNDIDDKTRLILVNAIYFKAKWKNAFSEIHAAAFYNGKNTYKCEFMNVKGEFNFYENNDFQVVEIPYASNLSSMIILLPKGKDLESIIQGLNTEILETISTNMKKQEMRLSIPKFKLETRTEMKKQFQSMGIKRAFSTKANFKRMNGKRNLMISDIIHQAVIELNEKGTEASAATAVIVKEKGAPRIPQFNANKPFVFFVRENKMGSILFSGILEKPQK